MYRTALIFLSLTVFSALQAQTEIEMHYQNGVYYIPCKVNGLQLNFIFDTGASDVCLSLTEAVFMLKNGYLSEDDLQGSSYYTIANGEVAEGTIVILRELQIGNFILYNVKASIIHNLDAPLLLGQSALSKLGKFNFDYSNSRLTISGNSSRVIRENPDKHYFSSIYYPDKNSYGKKILHIGLGGGIERLLFNDYAQSTVLYGPDTYFDTTLIWINAIGIKGEVVLHPLMTEHFSVGFQGAYSLGTRALFAGSKEKAGDGYSTEIEYLYTKLNAGGEIAGGFKTVKLLFKLNWQWQSNDYSKTISDDNNYSEAFRYDNNFDNQMMAFGLRLGGYGRAYPGYRGNTVDFLYTLTNNISPGLDKDLKKDVNGLADWAIGFGFAWWCQSAFKFQFDVIAGTQHKDIDELNFNKAWYQITLIYNHDWFY